MGEIKEDIKGMLDKAEDVCIRAFTDFVWSADCESRVTNAKDIIQNTFKELEKSLSEYKAGGKFFAVIGTSDSVSVLSGIQVIEANTIEELDLAIRENVSEDDIEELINSPEEKAFVLYGVDTPYRVIASTRVSISKELPEGRRRNAWGRGV